MARRCGRATSRFSGDRRITPGHIRTWTTCLCFGLFYASAAGVGLYSASDQILPLTPENVNSLLLNSTAAILVEFYASWCGHCVAFSPVYKSLARDIKEWKPAVDLAAMDCAANENRKACRNFGITGYPTIKFFYAYSNDTSEAQAFKGFPRDVRGLRHKIIDKLEAHREPWPPACPPLEPASQAEIDSFFETNNVQHLALIFEGGKSYIGREVTLDLLQFENIAVRRVLRTEEGLVSRLSVTEFPSCYLYYPGGNFTRLRVNIEARSFYSYALKGLPGVVRSGRPPPISIDVRTNTTEEPWRPFNRSRVYMADLESTLHYSLRVELAAHTVIRGEDLVSLKEYVSVLSKYFPGRQIVTNLLKSVNSWLQNQTGDEISYDAFREVLENSAQFPDTALPDGVRWVGCQGSLPYLRRYPCGVWTLFHVLTVQAKNNGSSDSLEVLTAMRHYVHSFFGCSECADHFENMASESLLSVNTLSSAVLWLWSRHNRVNNRLAGALSEDPHFPKIQWPSPEMCSSCHVVKENREHRWNNEEVLSFLRSYFSANRILTDYLDDESQVLSKQKEKQASQQKAVEAQRHLERKVREAPDSMAHPQLQLNVQEETEEEEEEDEGEEGPQDEDVTDEEEEGGEGAAPDEKPSEPTSWAKPGMEVGRGRRQAHRRPSIVGMRIRALQEDIVDLDSFVNQHYKAKALEMAASSRFKQRTLQRKEEPEPRPMFGLGMQLDTGLGMAGLQPIEEDFKMDVGQKARKRLKKRDLTDEYSLQEAELSHGGRWMSLLSIGFSKVDVSLCVILYFLSSVCLLTMYLFFKTRLRLRRAKVALP
ncbi:sulfhydryl oxidase 1 [Antennarius striatus]|uniref:sulfhydryl oxidase 1 n=1 Tax=Antennarius striatus TaxID=241820 RepID=UPI0035B39DC2